MELIAWYVVGFVLALTSRQALEYGTTMGLTYVKPKPIMYRTVILCAVCAIAGPLLIVPAVIFSVLWYLAHLSHHPEVSRISRWMNTPIVGRSGEKLQ